MSERALVIAEELDCRLRRQLWAFRGNRVSVRFEYEWHKHDGRWFLACGNENWEFNRAGLMQRHLASISSVAIEERDRKFAENGWLEIRVRLERRARHAPAH